MFHFSNLRSFPSIFRVKTFSLFLAGIVLAGTAFAGTAGNTTPPEEEKSVMEEVVSWYMDNMNYGTITLLMTVESSFIPFPSEVVVPPAAYKASQEGSDMNIVLVVLFATLGALIGAIINYYLALWLGRPIIYRFAESRLGRMCLLSSEKVRHAEDYFTRHGKASTFIGRLVPGVRQLISIPAGLAKMPVGSFLLYTGFGAFIWNVVLVTLGYIAHGNADLIDQYSKELSYILLVLGILFVLYLVYNGFFKAKKLSK
jgi:membrane protein DedA with SNARE-associated domain